VSGSLAVVAGPGPAGLACPPGAPSGGAGPVVTIGDAEPNEPRGAWVRWLAAPAPPREGALDVAPAGEGLWRRAPWPAADDLFDLAPAPPDAPVVVAGGEATRRGELAYALGTRDLPVIEAERLDRQALESAAAVLLFPAPGAEDALPAEAPAVLAARRLLITPAAAVTFGFLPGIDHLQFTLFWEAVEQLAAAREEPAALEPMRTWGAHAARRHLASRVLADLEADLRLLEVLP
jgi:hypothetical protein